MRKILFIIPILLLICSCTVQRQIVEVPVEVVKTEYIHDTIVDSIYVENNTDKWTKGDTVYIYNEHIKYRYLYKTDTVVKVDSIPKIIKIETVREVEVNHIKWYQKALMWIGGVMSLLLTGTIIYKVKFK